MEKFFSSMLPQWISRANLFALETLIYRCKEKNINLVLVMWPGGEMHKDNFDGAQVFNYTLDYIDDENDSRNHLTSSNHKKLLVQFTTEIKKGNIKI